MSETTNAKGMKMKTKTRPIVEALLELRDCCAEDGRETGTADRAIIEAERLYDTRDTMLASLEEVLPLVPRINCPWQDDPGSARHGKYPLAVDRARAAIAKAKGAE